MKHRFRGSERHQSSPLPWDHEFILSNNARKECMDHWQFLHKRPEMRNVPNRKWAMYRLSINSTYCNTAETDDKYNVIHT